tara:strand:+ start:7757 stop:8047 length:291 start_codon:yes stop_codon:yes gene_type:complete
MAFDYKAYNELKKTPKFWGFFDAANSQHKYILSLCRQNGWETINHQTGRSYADMERLGAWLQSDKSPVQKPLKKMDKEETSKIIAALEGMVTKKYQ